MADDNTLFVRSLENATHEIIQMAVANMRQAALRLENEAKKECPVDQGILRSSLTSEVSFDASKIVGAVGTNLSYAPYVHNGTGLYAKDGSGRREPWTYVARAGKYKGGHFTHGQKPNPFLERARDKAKDKIAEILADGDDGNA